MVLIYDKWTKIIAETFFLASANPQNPLKKELDPIKSDWSNSEILLEPIHLMGFNRVKLIESDWMNRF